MHSVTSNATAEASHRTEEPDPRVMEASAPGRYNLMVQASFFSEIHSAPGEFEATYFLATNDPRMKHS